MDDFLLACIVLDSNINSEQNYMFAYGDSLPYDHLY